MGLSINLTQQYKTLEGFEKQCSPLNLTPDAYNRIRRFSAQIIKTSLFSNMENLYTALRNTSNQKNSEAYKAMVKDLKSHLKHKMSIINDLKSKEPDSKENELDLWLRHFPNSKDLNFYEASLHLDDILFSCEILGKYELPEFISLQLSDLDAYKNKLVSNYTPLLSSDDEELQQAEKIAIKVDSLREAIQNQEFSRIVEICNKIREIAK